MQLYYVPFACSMAVRITLIELGLADQATFHEVDFMKKTYGEGQDYRKINTTGQVPTFCDAEGKTMTEAAVILQRLADDHPGAGLLPPVGDEGRYDVLKWLNITGAELHKQNFAMLFMPSIPAEMKAYVQETQLPAKLAWLNAELSGVDGFLVGDRFTIADGFLTTILNWTTILKIDLSPYPNVKAYRDRLLAYPAVMAAMAAEGQKPAA